MQLPIRFDFVAAFAVGLLCCLAFSSAQCLPNEWSKEEASDKIGKRVEYVGLPGHDLLQWGPRFPGWSPEKQPKSIGKAIKKGACGTIKEFIKTPRGGYLLVVHWDQEEGKQTYWATVFTRSDYPAVIELRP